MIWNVNFIFFGDLLKSIGKQVRSGSLIVELKSEADSEGNQVFLVNKIYQGKKKRSKILFLLTLIVPLK